MRVELCRAENKRKEIVVVQSPDTMGSRGFKVVRRL